MSAFKAASENWNALIEDVVAGRWRDPASGRTISLPFEAIRLEPSLEGAEADLVAPLNLGSRLAVVSDTNTVEAMGRRVAKALRAIASVEEIVLPDGIACTEATIADIQQRTRGADGVVAVGSGVLNDSCKHATFQDGRPYAVFGTAASMNGYGATTASVTLSSGLKASLPSHAPRGIFLDLGVSSAAPSWLSAAGLGDSLCRPTAQIDWWASHRLFGTPYSRTPYILQAGDEGHMLARAAGLARHDLPALGSLQRVLTLCSLGVAVTGTSHHGSMGEHQISHWIDMFAKRGSPECKHGHQVGVASLTMARLQHAILSRDSAPVVRRTVVDEVGMFDRYGPVLGPLCIEETRKTALDEAEADTFNQRLADLWTALKRELAPMALPVATMEAALVAAGGPTTPGDLGLTRDAWRDAVRFSREIRGRWSFVNVATDAGLLDAVLEAEP